MSNLKSVLKCWADFNLPNLQKSLDETASETVERQESGEKGKKLLIKLTKDWKSASSEEVRTSAAPLIKAFQKEIDSLHKRSKAAENAFLLVYKNLLEIPDPVPVLKQAENIKKQLEKTKDLELENQQLRATLEEYHVEFADVKNQEVTIQKLKEKIKTYEDKAEEKLNTLSVEKEKALEAVFEEREHKLLDSKLELATKLGDTEARLRVTKEELDKCGAAIFDLKSSHEEELMARLSEIELLESDLERANQQLLAAERFSETFKTQFNKEWHDSVDGNCSQNEAAKDTIQMLEFQLLSKDRELSELMESVHYQQSLNDKMKKSSEREVLSLETSIEKKSAKIEFLVEQLNERVDYDEVKRELKVLKMIEFSGLDEQGEEQTAVGKPLEKLLLEKNKKLQSECTKFKVVNAELNGKYDQLQKTCSETFRTVSDQKNLITQLEKDLMSVRQIPSSVYRGEGVGAASPNVTTEFISKAVAGLDYEADEVDKHTAESLLPIISNQRERFKTKNQQLENQNLQQERQITSLQSEVDTVRQDNVKLYEKIKFLQSYSGQSGSRSVAVDDESVTRYSNSYEERIDPFNLFSRKEKQQRYSNLSTPEKITLNMGRFILSNKIARTLVFFYTVMLHCLVFVVLYKFAYTESCKYSMLPVVGHLSVNNHPLGADRNLIS